MPGVHNAALTSVVPMSNSSMQSSVRREGQSANDRVQANLRLASGGYFAAMGMRLLAGRDIDTHDDASAPFVVVANEALVKKLWPGIHPREAIGKRIDALPQKRDGQTFRTVVGVVNDVRDALDQSPKPEFYLPFEQTPPILWSFMARSLVLVVRASNPNADTTAMLKPLRSVVAQLDASLPIAESRTMTSYLKGTLETARMNTLLLSILGGIALVLAMVGIYGVVPYFVNQRTHEIGVRIALGATPGRIWQLVVRRGLSPILVGLVIGLALSTVTTKVLEGRLFGVTPHDPATLAAVTILLVAVGLVATYVPARRAMRVPPLVALNEG